MASGWCVLTFLVTVPQPSARQVVIAHERFVAAGVISSCIMFKPGSVRACQLCSVSHHSSYIWKSCGPGHGMVGNDHGVSVGYLTAAQRSSNHVLQVGTLHSDKEERTIAYLIPKQWRTPSLTGNHSRVVHRLLCEPILRSTTLRFLGRVDDHSFACSCTWPHVRCWLAGLRPLLAWFGASLYNRHFHLSSPSLIPLPTWQQHGIFADTVGLKR